MVIPLEQARPRDQQDERSVDTSTSTDSIQVANAVFGEPKAPTAVSEEPVTGGNSESSTSAATTEGITTSEPLYKKARGTIANDLHEAYYEDLRAKRNPQE